MAALPAAGVPYGGIRDTGHGSEGGCGAVEACLDTRAVSIMNG
ncbi:MAG: hypothetical protein RLZZ584_3006 [Pseudomonadota bacterium]